MINFCHIMPTSMVPDFAVYNGAHLFLAHLVKESSAYADMYYYMPDKKLKIMDNSAFEMYKQGKPMFPTSELIDLAKKSRADMIVLSDYPKEDGLKTIKAAQQMIWRVKDEGFKTFFCPQSKLGDIDDLMLSIEWAIENPEIDRIGISILNCPVGCGIEETKHGEEGTRSDSFKLQRFLSRWNIFKQMEKRGLLQDYDKVKGRFHCLGMTDGPREIELLEPYRHTIASWDSSAAVWAGIHGIEFDKSPTGLMDGKFEKEVDFDWNGEYDVGLVRHNIQYINRLCK